MWADKERPKMTNSGKGWILPAPRNSPGSAFGILKYFVNWFHKDPKY